jgi:1-deoxy-D-xylulose-5-phosphate synthase
MAEQKILDRITSPHQLRRLEPAELSRLADELRQRIIEVVSANGGHLASNLGVAELTIALHHVFDFTRDRLLWDVGHQCYAHKILTGRGARFGTLRKRGGLSGFPSPQESEYDLFSTGHAGAAISTAVGLAWADQAEGLQNNVVAVVGDASIVNGLAMEGLNNAAMLGRQLLVILNDNSMAIDRTQGAMAHALDRIRMTGAYSGFKHSAQSVLHRMPGGEGISTALKKLKAGIRTSIRGERIFEGLGFEYYGPVDGHNLPELIRVLGRLSTVRRPVLLHVHTEKGRGCQYAVEDPCRFHSPSAYRVENGQAVFTPRQHPTWTQEFSRALVELGERDERVVALTAAMPDGTGLVEFRKRFPTRYIDVGINESHAVAMAAGLARRGRRPIVAVYSTFLQRAFDQVFQEVCLQKLPVLFCLDRAGLVGSDGAVHHGFLDIAFLRPLPGMTLMAPAFAEELRCAMELAMGLEGPAAIRYPRDEAAAAPAGLALTPWELGRAAVMPSPGCAQPKEITAGPAGREYEADQRPAAAPPEAAQCDAFLFAYGAMVEQCLAAAELLAGQGICAGVVNARFAKPLDEVLLTRLLGSGKPVLVVEDHAVACGIGAAALELAAGRGLDASRVALAGMPDRFIAHASREEQLAEVGLSPEAIAANVKDLVEQRLHSRTTPSVNR